MAEEELNDDEDFPPLPLSEKKFPPAPSSSSSSLSPSGTPGRARDGGVGNLGRAGEDFGMGVRGFVGFLFLVRECGTSERFISLIGACLGSGS